jgi:hypothetical protein
MVSLLVIYQTKRRHIADDGNLHSHYFEQHIHVFVHGKERLGYESVSVLYTQSATLAYAIDLL